MDATLEIGRAESAHAAQTTQTTQMNTRIGVRLKERGDKALARAGYTPSRAVRALYEFAVRHEHDPETIAALLSDEHEETEEQIKRREARLAAVQGIDAIVELQQKLLGDDYKPGSDKRPFKQVWEEAMDEHFAEKGLL